jgi:hypothetical protein
MKRFDPLRVFLLLAAVAGLADCLDAPGGLSSGQNTSKGTVATLSQAERSDEPTSCPPPTVSRWDACVLTGDAILSETLVVRSPITIDCNDFTLRPAAIGSSTTTGGYTPSVPEVAIALIRATGATVRRCGIGDEASPFDMGVAVLASKVPMAALAEPGERNPSGNQIVHNRIAARVQGIVIVSSDATWVAQNDIHWSSGAGQGVLVNRDSVKNVIRDNHISSPGAPLLYPCEGARRVPGDDLSAGACRDCGVLVADAFFFPLVNAIIGSELVQLPYTGHGPVDTLIEGNLIELPGDSDVSGGCKFHGGVVSAVTSRGNHIRGNTVHAAGIGIRLEGFSQTNFWPFVACEPGTCSLDSTRFCYDDSGCFISGIDTATKGTCSLQPVPGLEGFCPFTTAPSSVDGRAFGARVVDNRLVGPFNLGGGIRGDANYQALIRGNEISGTGSKAGEAGIWLLADLLENAIVTNNVVRDVAYGLFLDDSEALGEDDRGSFGATITRNDFHSSVRAIFTTDTYHYPSEISSGGLGNFWGRTCPEGGFNRDAPPFACAPDYSSACTTDNDCAREFGTCDLSLNVCTGNSNVFCLADIDCNVIFSCGNPAPRFDSRTPDVVDSHPLGQPIARRDAEETAHPCF